MAKIYALLNGKRRWFDPVELRHYSRLYIQISHLEQHQSNVPKTSINLLCDQYCAYIDGRGDV